MGQRANVTIRFKLLNRIFRDLSDFEPLGSLESHIAESFSKGLNKSPDSLNCGTAV